jgi:hypothetical protein
MRRGPAVICLIFMWLTAACVGAESSATPRTSVQAPTGTPTAGATPESTPAESTASSEPGQSPSDAPSESPSESPSIAAACTGTDANREFFATVAPKVTWDVYCGVLPRGWTVETGSYRTSSGGWLKIAYKASGGRRFELREGKFCTDPATCVPSGTEIAGGGPLGDREGKLLQVADGGFALIVDQGQPVMWAAIGKGMDQATFMEYAAAAALVAP